MLAGKSAADVEGIKQRLHDARLNELALHRAIELQELELQKAHREIAAEIHKAEQSQLDDALANIITATIEALDAIDRLGALKNDLAERGAPLLDDQFRGVMSARDVAAYFHLPTPELCKATRERLIEHWQRHFPAAADKADI